MLFKILVLLGKITGIGFLPVSRVFNCDGTERITLRRDGWVVIDSPLGGTKDALRIFLVSTELQKRLMP